MFASLPGFWQRGNSGENPKRYVVFRDSEIIEHWLAERIVGESDVQRLLDAESCARDHVLLALLYAAGLRVSQACGLLWRNVGPCGDAGQITVFGKNGRTRSIT